MKAKLTIVLLLVMAFSLFSESSLFSVPVASSVTSVSFGSVSLGAKQVSGGSLNITGNLAISGNNITRFAGLSSDVRLQVYLNGSIEVTENATLVLQYVVLYFVGSKAPYDRYIRLSNASNGHPRLIVSNATLVSYSTSSQKVSRTLTRDVSCGGAIFAYDDSEITGKEFAFYRRVVSSLNASAGGPTLIKAFDTSRVDLSFATMDSVQSFDNVNVTIAIGGGPGRLGRTGADQGIAFTVYNTSEVSVYGVKFNGVTLFDHAYMSLTSSTEMSSFKISTNDFSKVDIAGGTTLKGSYSAPGVIAAGNSSTTLVSSKAESSVRDFPIITTEDNGTVSVANGSIQGKIQTYGFSRVFLSNMRSPTSLTDVRFEGHDFSHVFITNCSFWPGLKTTTFEIFDNSSFTILKSLIQTSLLSFHNNASLRLLSSNVISSRLSLEAGATVMVVNSSVREALTMGGYSSLLMNSSSVQIVFGLENSRISLINSRVAMVTITGASGLFSNNSTIDDLSVTSSNATGSLADLTNFYSNSSLAFPGTSVHVDLLSTYVNGLDLVFLGNSNVSISNASIRNLDLQGNSVANLTSVSIGNSFLTGNAKVYFWVPLRVRSVDYFGSPLNGSKVIVQKLSGGTIKQGVTGEDGWANFLLFSEFVNATGVFPVGLVAVTCNYGRTTGKQRVTLDVVSKDVVVSLPLPFWTGYILPGVIVLAIIVALALMAFVYGRIRKKS